MISGDLEEGRRWVETTLAEEAGKMGLTPALEWETAPLRTSAGGRLSLTVQNGDKRETVAFKEAEVRECARDAALQSGLRFRIRTILSDLAGTLESHED